MDGDDLELFERSVRHAAQTTTGADLDAALAELGWSDALEDDPRAAISILFGLQGTEGSTSCALDLVVDAASGLGTDAAVVLPAIGGAAAPGVLTGDRLLIDGLTMSAITRADSALVVASSSDGDVAVLVPTADLHLRPVHGIDPDLGLVEVGGETNLDAGAMLPTRPDWESAVALSRLALAHELIGASRRMLEEAREHALERVQFGVPISSFQAIRHRLAETLVAIETADSLLAAAWDDRSPVTASMAKALAGRGARVTARHCQQVLAGIGFTTEHPLHLSIRRVFVLDEMFGASRTLTTELGEELLRTRTLPALPLL